MKLQGIYFIYDKAELVYIGKTTNLENRFSSHKYLLKGRQYRFLPIDNASDMALLELAYIDKFKPIENKQDKFDTNNSLIKNLIDLSTLPLNTVTKDSSTINNYINLNFKGSIMDLFTYQAKLCKSSRDIELFREVLLTVDKHNEFRVVLKQFAEICGVSRQRLSKFLKDAVDIGFMKRIERGVYVVDPFAFKAKGANNTTIEELQKTWNTLSTC